ncbi:H-NS family nucleoid-associated regulatory protein [Bradyrhizobium genosp. A]|uniref:H-NS histone family protein n=1 Tax=Bradyrhizobium genosp. A TaxID=83626 RepID=UPI003CEFE5CB
MANSIAQKLNLESMSVDEMWHLHEEISRILSIRLTTEKQELEKRLAQLRREDDMRKAASSGLHAIDTVPRTRRKYPKVLPKYRNPKNVSETWSGRGKQPRWLVAALKTGCTIDEFVIDASRAGKRKTSERRRRSHSSHA